MNENNSLYFLLSVYRSTSRTYMWWVLNNFISPFIETKKAFWGCGLLTLKYIVLFCLCMKKSILLSIERKQQQLNIRQKELVLINNNKNWCLIDEYIKNVITLTIQAIVNYMCYFLMSLKKRLKLRKCMFEISLINLQFKRFSNEKQEAGCRMSTKLQEKVIFQKEQSFSFSRFPFSRQSTGALSVCIFFFAFCFTRHKRFYSKQVFFYYCF